MKLNELIEENHTIASKWLFKHDVSYIMKNLGNYIVELGKSLDSDKYVQKRKNIWISNSAKVSNSAVMVGPLIIDDGAVIRDHASIRENVIVGKKAVIGHCSEIKNSIISNEAKLAHFNYVGDSIIGYQAHLAASAVVANQRLTKTEIVLDDNDDMGLKKLGAIVGDNVEIGCQAVLYPGVIIGKNSIIYPLVRARGVIVQNSIVKNDGKREFRRPSGKIFGTDGIRGIVHDDLTMEFVMCVAEAIVKVLLNSRNTIVIGQDTRESSDWIRYCFISTLLSHGVHVIDAKVLPTPAISYLTKKYQADFGIMITASHNPVQYNGIKIFNENGEKIGRELEESLEEWIRKNHKIIQKTPENGRLIEEVSCRDDYVQFLRNSIDISLDELKIAVDCANGATSKIIGEILKGSKAEVILLNNEPNGVNINKNCGVLELEAIVQWVMDNQCDCGIAYDGDGDRCIMIDSHGNIVDGDDVLAILARYYKREGKLSQNTIVSTILCNLGLEEFCEKLDIRLIKTDVGDRNVMEAMKDNKAILGAEPSGHVILGNYLHSGDGELVSLKILEIMKKENKSLSELAGDIRKYPKREITIKVNFEEKEKFKRSAKIHSMIVAWQNNLLAGEKMIVRLSGTEPVIRILVEGLDIQKMERLAQDLKRQLERELNGC